jgi:hypothetical protein
VEHCQQSGLREDIFNPTFHYFLFNPNFQIFFQQVFKFFIKSLQVLEGFSLKNELFGKLCKSVRWWSRSRKSLTSRGFLCTGTFLCARDNLRGQKSLGPLKMSLEMAHKVVVPQKKMSRSFLNCGTLIVCAQINRFFAPFRFIECSKLDVTVSTDTVYTVLS